VKREETYYQILGLLPDAEDIVIKAAYRVLAQRYHPDKNVGDPVAAERMAEINEAYEVLSDPVKKSEYDEKIKDRQSDFDSTFSGGPDTDAFNMGSEDDWKYASSYFPEIEKIRHQLLTLNHSLALAYQVLLLEHKTFNQAADIAKTLKKNFLTRYFGESDLLRNYAEKCIMEGRRDVALELNKAVRILGGSLHPKELLAQIEDRFNPDGGFARRREKLQRLTKFEYQLRTFRELSVAHSAIEFMGGKTIVTGLVRKLFQTDIDGQKCAFDNDGHYVDFVLTTIRQRLSNLES
jgi:hypothetical protein